MTDKLRFQCHACEAVFRAPLSIAGKSRPCPKCEAPLRFPKVDDAAAVEEPVRTVAPAAKAPAGKSTAAPQRGTKGSATRAKSKAATRRTSSDSGDTARASDAPAEWWRDRKVQGGIAAGAVLLVVVLAVVLGGGGESPSESRDDSEPPEEEAGPLVQRVAQWQELRAVDLRVPRDGEEGRFIGYTARGLAVSPNGQRIVTIGQHTNTLRMLTNNGEQLWMEDINDLHHGSIFPGNDGSVFVVQRRRIVGRTTAGALKLWPNVSTGASPGGEFAVYVERQRGEQRAVVIARADHAERVVGDIGRRESGSIDNVMACAVSPDGRLLYFVMASNSLQVWDVESSEQRRSVELADGDDPREITLSPDGRRLAMVLSSRTEVRVFDADSLQPVGDTLSTSENVSELEFSPDGTILMGRHFSGTIERWNLAEQTHQTIEFRPEGTRYRSPDSSALSDDATVVAFITDRREVTLYDVANGTPLHTITLTRAGGGSNYSLAFLPGDVGLAISYGQQLHLIGPATTTN